MRSHCAHSHSHGTLLVNWIDAHRIRPRTIIRTTFALALPLLSLFPMSARAQSVALNHDRQQLVPAQLFPDVQRRIKALDNSSRANYSSARQQQQRPSTIGPGAVVGVPKEDVQVTESAHLSEQKLDLEPPLLKALISIRRDLNPFSLDSELQQQVNLKDVLLTASGANLDILDSVAFVQSRNWAYKNSMTSYLPTINLGFNQIGLNSKINLPLKSTGVFPGSSTPVTAEVSQTTLVTPLTILNSGFSWTPIQGGRLLATIRSQRHHWRASKAKLTSDINDVLLAATNSYWDLVYNSAVLQIRISAVNTSTEQVRQNSILAKHGQATTLDVLQARAQLSKDRQNLLDQQRNRRSSAIKLARILNANLGQDLIPSDTVLRKIRLISEDSSVSQMLQLAVDNRSELKQFEELRLAARQQINTARAGLLPSASLGGNIIGIGSKTGSMQPTYLLNFGITWQFEGLGATAMTNIAQARWQARQAMLQANKIFLDVCEQVRNSYNQTATAERAIDEATEEVISAQEELRLARLRLNNGLGTNLEVLTAQRDLTQARVDQALALVNYNKSQAQLLHDVGLMSIDNVTSGRIINLPVRR